MGNPTYAHLHIAALCLLGLWALLAASDNGELQKQDARGAGANDNSPFAPGTPVVDPQNLFNSTTPERTIVLVAQLFDFVSAIQVCHSMDLVLMPFSGVMRIWSELSALKAAYAWNLFVAVDEAVSERPADQEDWDMWGWDAMLPCRVQNYKQLSPQAQGYFQTSYRPCQWRMAFACTDKPFAMSLGYQANQLSDSWWNRNQALQQSPYSLGPLHSSVHLVQSDLKIGMPEPPANAAWYDGTDQFWEQGPLMTILWRIIAVDGDGTNLQLINLLPIHEKMVDQVFPVIQQPTLANTIPGLLGFNRSLDTMWEGTVVGPWSDYIVRVEGCYNEYSVERLALHTRLGGVHSVGLMDCSNAFVEVAPPGGYLAAIQGFYSWKSNIDDSVAGRMFAIYQLRFLWAATGPVGQNLPSTRRYSPPTSVGKGNCSSARIEIQPSRIQLYLCGPSAGVVCPTHMCCGGTVTGGALVRSTLKCSQAEDACLEDTCLKDYGQCAIPEQGSLMFGYQYPTNDAPSSSSSMDIVYSANILYAVDYARAVHYCSTLAQLGLSWELVGSEDVLRWSTSINIRQLAWQGLFSRELWVRVSAVAVAANQGVACQKLELRVERNELMHVVIPSRCNSSGTVVCRAAAGQNTTGNSTLPGSQSATLTSGPVRLSVSRTVGAGPSGDSCGFTTLQDATLRIKQGELHDAVAAARPPTPAVEAQSASTALARDALPGTPAPASSFLTSLVVQPLSSISLSVSSSHGWTAGDTEQLSGVRLGLGHQPPTTIGTVSTDGWLDFELQEGEVIIAVSGCAGGYVERLVFHTSTGRRWTTPITRHSLCSTAFLETPSPGGYLVGMQGIAGNSVEQLQFIWAAPAEAPATESKAVALGVGLGVGLGVVSLALGLTAAFVCWRRRRRTADGMVSPSGACCGIRSAGEGAATAIKADIGSKQGDGGNAGTGSETWSSSGDGATGGGRKAGKITSEGIRSAVVVDGASLTAPERQPSTPAKAKPAACVTGRAGSCSSLSGYRSFENPAGGGTALATPEMGRPALVSSSGEETARQTDANHAAAPTSGTEGPDIMDARAVAVATCSTSSKRNGPRPQAAIGASPAAGAEQHVMGSAARDARAEALAAAAAQRPQGPDCRGWRVRPVGPRPPGQSAMNSDDVTNSATLCTVASAERRSDYRTDVLWRVEEGARDGHRPQPEAGGLDGISTGSRGTDPVSTGATGSAGGGFCTASPRVPQALLRPPSTAWPKSAESGDANGHSGGTTARPSFQARSSAATRDLLSTAPADVFQGHRLRQSTASCNVDQGPNVHKGPGIGSADGAGGRLLNAALATGWTGQAHLADVVWLPRGGHSKGSQGESAQPDPALNMELGRDVEVDSSSYLGRGGCGLVRRGVLHTTEGDVPVAVKMLSTEASESGTGVQVQHLQGFEQEVHVLSRLAHPNIVRFYGARLDPANSFIVEELMVTSLDKLVHGKSQKGLEFKHEIGLVDILRISRDVAAGLSYLHPTVVHRDLKPGNVLLDESGIAKLGDFGLARFKANTALTSRDIEVGTAPYMAPEVFMGNMEAKVTDRADMYSLGVIINEMVTRQKPWEGMRPVVIGFQVAVERKRPALPPADSPMCPRGLRSIIERCWRHNPDERPSSAEIVKRLTLLLAEHTGTLPAGSIIPLASRVSSQSFLLPPPALVTHTSATPTSPNDSTRSTDVPTDGDGAKSHEAPLPRRFPSSAQAAPASSPQPFQQQTSPSLPQAKSGPGANKKNRFAGALPHRVALMAVGGAAGAAGAGGIRDSQSAKSMPRESHPAGSRVGNSKLDWHPLRRPQSTALLVSDTDAVMSGPGSQESAAATAPEDCDGQARAGASALKQVGTGSSALDTLNGLRIPFYAPNGVGHH